MKLKERTPEARIAYLEGYQFAVKQAAQIAEEDRRTELAKQYGYEPKFHKVQREIANRIWRLAGLAELVSADR